MQYQPNILIIGQSGTGKSCSMRNLPRDESVHYIDNECKGLPFKGTFAVHKYPSTFRECEDALRESLADEKCKIIVFESFIKYCEMSVSSCRAAFKNWDIWNNHSCNIAQMLALFKSRNKIIVVTGIDELVVGITESGGTTNVRRASVSMGKEWEGKIEKEFLITLYTSPKRNEQGEVVYRFLTNSDGVVNAKSPMGMLPPEMDNDTNLVLTKIQEYYKQ